MKTVAPVFYYGESPSSLAICEGELLQKVCFCCVFQVSEALVDYDLESTLLAMVKLPCSVMLLLVETMMGND
jgi:hypothetical protein